MLKIVKATNGGQHEMWKLAFRPPLVALKVLLTFKNMNKTYNVGLQMVILGDSPKFKKKQ